MLFEEHSILAILAFLILVTLALVVLFIVLLGICYLLVYSIDIVRFIRRAKGKNTYIKSFRLSIYSPPRATFFARTNGKYTFIQGPYESKYLNTWQRKLWERNKKKKAQLADKSSKKYLIK